mgnify:FL=1
MSFKFGLYYYQLEGRAKPAVVGFSKLYKNGMETNEVETHCLVLFSALHTEKTVLSGWMA